MRNIGAIVLAAGGSTRLGQPKQLITIGGETLVRRIVNAARAAGCARVTVVVGGAAFRAVPNLWRQVAADAFAADLRGVQTLFARPS